MDGRAGRSVVGTRLAAACSDGLRRRNPLCRARVSYALRVEDRQPGSRVVVERIPHDEDQETQIVVIDARARHRRSRCVSGLKPR
jgi:hypothetical protein